MRVLVIGSGGREQAIAWACRRHGHDVRVAADLPDGWRDHLLRAIDPLPERLEEFDTLMTGQPIWQNRLQGVGAITTEDNDPWDDPYYIGGPWDMGYRASRIASRLEAAIASGTASLDAMQSIQGLNLRAVSNRSRAP